MLSSSTGRRGFWRGPRRCRRTSRKARPREPIHVCHEVMARAMSAGAIMIGTKRWVGEPAARGDLFVCIKSRRLVTACDRVACAAEVFGQIDFHLGGGFEGHGVEVREEFGKETEAVAFDDPGGFDAGLVIGESFVGSE